MLNNKGFDLWADDYEKSVAQSDKEGSYPFAGYRRILNEIYNRLLNESCKNVLDIGFGTGTLLSKLYRQGLKIYGQDFSERMIEIAQKKMPKAKLYKGDISEGLVGPLLKHNFDAIIATYSLHHLTDSKKVTLLKSLLAQLSEGGCIYIGDVAFESRHALNRCRMESGDKRDRDEIYFVIDELKAYFPSMQFEKASECAGLIILQE